MNKLGQESKVWREALGVGCFQFKAQRSRIPIPESNSEALRGLLGPGPIPCSESVSKAIEVGVAETIECLRGSSHGEAPMTPPLEGWVAWAGHEQAHAPS